MRNPISTLTRDAGRRLRGPLVALALAVMLATLGPGALDALASAPPFATTTIDAGVYATPDFISEPIGTIPAGTDIEITGNAAPGFLEVYYGGGTAWVPSQYLSLGVRPGIDTAVTLRDTPLVDAPMPEGDVLAIVPADETVILTGASVNGYDAASHEGVGGWINAGDIAR